MKEREATFSVLDLCLDAVNGVAALDVDRDRLARYGFHENLHHCVFLSLSLSLRFDFLSTARCSPVRERGSFIV